MSGSGQYVFLLFYNWLFILNVQLSSGTGSIIFSMSVHVFRNLFWKLYPLFGQILITRFKFSRAFFLLFFYSKKISREQSRLIGYLLNDARTFLIRKVRTCQSRFWIDICARLKDLLFQKKLEGSIFTPSLKKRSFLKSSIIPKKYLCRIPWQQKSFVLYLQFYQ